MYNINFVAGRSLGFPTAPPTPLTIQQDDSRVRYGGAGTWVNESSSFYYGGTGKYNTSIGGFYEVTMPAGFTRVVFQGSLSIYAGAFEFFKNGVLVGSGTCNGNTLYTDYITGIGVEGDIFRFVNAANGSQSILADQLTFSN